MFGYVKPYVPELKVREHELYRAMYCGLCRSMGGVTGQVSRLTLSYDFVFLTAVRLLLTGDMPPSEQVRCPAHPLSRRNAVCDNSVFRYAAAVSASLFAEKLEDDISDEAGARRIMSKLLRPAARHMVKKSGTADVPCAGVKDTTGSVCDNQQDYASGSHCEKITPFLKSPEEAAAEACRNIPPLLAQLSALEADGCKSIDRCASVFGELTSHLFSAGLESAAARIAGEIGYGTGRFIYVADACDDAPEDLLRGRFNPIIAAYGRDAVCGSRLSPYVAEELYTAALLDLRRTSAAAELACDYICPGAYRDGGTGADADSETGTEFDTDGEVGSAGNKITAAETEPDCAVRGDRDVAAIVRNIIYLGMPHIIRSIINTGEAPAEDKRKVYLNG